MRYETDPTVVELEKVVRNREGLHFRPIMRLVDAASRFQAKLTLHAGDRSADARSPMELLMLVATCGTKLRVVAEGEDAEQAAAALGDLIDSGFGETLATEL